MACAPRARCGEAARRGYVLELRREPVAVMDAELRAKGVPAAHRKSASASQLRAIEAEQQAVLSELNRKQGGQRLLFRVQRVYNGIGVLTRSEAAAKALGEVAGVKAVHPLAAIRRGNASSVPFIGAPAAWQTFALKGEGMRIGIIDTGIDYQHPDFGGTATAEERAANDPAVLGDAPFPTPKVAGGIDLVGDDYNAFDPRHQDPVPDPDPMDANGHGTHVAGTAAGLGVTAGGAPYAGPYTTTANYRALAVGPGVAPAAELYAIKMFGRLGDSLMLLPALEWAVDPDGDGDLDDRLDAINMSLGDDFGPFDAPEAIAAGNAVRAGAIVVAAAGNAYDAHFIAGMPGNAPGAIAVAATQDADRDQPSLVPDRLAAFSSRGPAQSHSGALLLKPDIAAPGVGIDSAAAFAIAQGQPARRMSGTSMGTPHVSGAMALLRQAHPDWSVAELKALAMNTAALPLAPPPGIEADAVSPQRAGAGRIAVVPALQTEVIAYNASQTEAVSITFATRDIAESTSESQTLRIENKGDQPQAFALRLEESAAIPGVSVRIDGVSAGTLPPGAAVDVSLRLDAAIGALRHARDPSAAANFDLATETIPRTYIAEASGRVRIALDGTAQELSVPYYAAVRAVSDMHAEKEVFDARPGGDISIALSGRGIDTGAAPPESERSLVSAAELLYVSPRDPAHAGLASAADIQYLGATSDYAAQRAAGRGIAETTISLALATHGDWFTPHWVRIFFFIDANGDGLPEQLIDNFPLRTGDPNGGANPDAFISRLADPENKFFTEGYLNHLPADDYDTRPFMSNVMVLPVRAADLGLDEEHTTIGFQVQALLAPNFDIPGEQQLIDVVPPRNAPLIVYDVARPGIAFTPGLNGQPIYYDEPGVLIGAPFDPAAYSANRSLGILLLHHHNAAGARAQWLPVISEGDTDGDGIADAGDGVADIDGDGLPNLVDADSDGDGIPDAEEGAGDADQDDTPNFLDRDSDNDGLSDSDESSVHHTSPVLTDTDGDGRGDRAEIEAGTDPLAPQVPEAPSNLRASDGDFADRVELEWDSVPGDTQYRVFRGDSDDFSAALPLGDDWKAATTFSDTGAVPPYTDAARGCRPGETVYTRHVYWVKARNAGGESPESAPEGGFRGGAPQGQAAAGIDAGAVFALLFFVGLARVCSSRRMHAAG